MTKVQIAKWGNSSAIRLPKAVMEALGLKPGDTVELDVRDGEAVIAPGSKKSPFAPPLEKMIAEMERLGWENEPETVDWGPDVGSERFWEDE